jgi:hypothetical protein
MCNLYSIATNQAAIIGLFRVITSMSAICRARVVANAHGQFL